MKKCQCCKKEKLLDKFGINHLTDQIKTNCLECVDKHKIWRSKNIDQLNKKSRENYKKDSAKIKETIIAWRRRNPEKWAKIRKPHDHNARSKRRGAEGKITKKDINYLYEKQNGQCYYCNTELHNKFQKDHKIPLSRGGTNWPDNIALTCAVCNNKKGTQTAEEFMRRVF